MKKSTLITTIAMIVVVVVALSTATYAWFSASSIAIATVEMSTSATADWALVEGNRTAGSAGAATVSFAGASSDMIQWDNADFRGLWSPTAAITTTIEQSLQANAANEASFYSAKKTGATVTQDADAAIVAPKYLRVVNTYNGPRPLVLKVVLILSADGANTASYYAAAATKFAICNDKGLYATNGYNYKTAVGSGKAFTGGANEYTKSGTALTVKDTQSAENFNYTNPNLTNYFISAGGGNSDDEAKWGVQSGNNYVVYTIDFGTVPKDGFVNLALYTWIDGWVADASAANASFSLRYAFTTGAVQAG